MTLFSGLISANSDNCFIVSKTRYADKPQKKHKHEYLIQICSENAVKVYCCENHSLDGWSLEIMVILSFEEY